MVALMLGALAINLYAVCLVLARAKAFRTPVYRPMLWNVFLSILPILILMVALFGWIFALFFSTVLGYIVLLITASAWLLVLPNSSYLITELNQSHRVNNDRVPMWFDIILVISLAMSGVVNTVINVFLAHTIFSLTVFGDQAGSYTEPIALVSVACIIFLIAFGMYLGRYPRFNSWDLTHPRAFTRKAIDHFSVRTNRLAAFGFTLTYGMFIALIYVMIAGPIIENLRTLEQIRG